MCFFPFRYMFGNWSSNDNDSSSSGFIICSFYIHMNIQKYVDEKYISVQKHPTADLYIYNYTPKAQFDRVWTEETMMCRGLILDGSGKVIARPFPKFFNLDEAIAQGEDLPLENFAVTEKYDGSLGILYWIGDTPYLATRGSFTSDQAIVGTKILHQKYSFYFPKLNRKFTYLFEIIYPENRIVVDYKGKRDLILLAVIETETGVEQPILENILGFTFAGFVDGISDYNKLAERSDDNKEGYVIRFANGKRYKVKFDEYVRLHKLITGINARRIWDLLRNNQPLDELLERVPDEFYKWVKDIKEGLERDYQRWFDVALRVYGEVIGFDTRKEQAKHLEKYDCRDIVFRMLDGKQYDDAIWKKLKPAHETPFKMEI